MEVPEEIDIISSMPDDVINNILERLPIHEAVRTGILSREWRYKWTMLTQLDFDTTFFECLQDGCYRGCGKSIISWLLVHLKGSITRFDLLILEEWYLDEEDINNWILFLSKKGLKVLTLINFYHTIRLTSHIFSCVELSHLELCNFELGPVPDHFRGFPNLSSFDFQYAHLDQTYNFSKFLTRYCPDLESLRFYSDFYYINETDIAKLVNLKNLFWEVGSRHDKKTITSSQIFLAIGSLTKLSDLCINFADCLQVLEDVRSAPTALVCLKKLNLQCIDLSSKSMVSLVVEVIRASPNVHSLDQINV